MENNLTLPITGGIFSTDWLIVVAVAIVFAIAYVLFCILRENKNDDLKEFRDDDFIDDEQAKQ